MKYLLTLSLLLFTSVILNAQKNNYTVAIGKIRQSGGGKPKYGPIIDTVKITDVVKTKKIRILVQGILENGTEDINKCFIPRDAVLIYKDGKLATKVLVCFECDGIRITQTDDSSVSSLVKNITKRETQIKELAALIRQ